MESSSSSSSESSESDNSDTSDSSDSESSKDMKKTSKKKKRVAKKVEKKRFRKPKNIVYYNESQKPLAKRPPMEEPIPMKSAGPSYVYL